MLVPPEVIVVAVRRYPRFNPSYRDVEELLVEPGAAPPEDPQAVGGPDGDSVGTPVPSRNAARAGSPHRSATCLVCADSLYARSKGIR
jgi:hypothetical protein